MSIASDRTFAVDGAKLTGECTSVRGASNLMAEVMGKTVKFNDKVEFAGRAREFVYSGTLDRRARGMAGSVVVFGMSTDFTAE